MSARWVVLVGLAAVSLAIFTGYQQYERGRTIEERGRTIAERGRAIADIQARIEVLKTRQLEQKARFDALLAESEKAPNDPVVLKALGARHLELAKEDQALKDDLDRLQRDLDAVKR
jgi:septal ring factor EnvC (AmiA/AmiB activator)